MTAPTPMTREAVEALLEGATPGVWNFRNGISAPDVVVADGVRSDVYDDDLVICGVSNYQDAVTDATGRLLAAAPALARQLLDTMDANAKLEAMLKVHAVDGCRVCNGRGTCSTGRAQVSCGRKLKRGEGHSTQVECPRCADARTALSDTSEVR